MHPPALHSYPLLDHLFLSLPLLDKIYPTAPSVLNSLSKYWLYDAWSMSQARGKGGPLFKFICNYENIQACAGMPALCLKKNTKTVSNNVFLFKRGLGPSEPLRVACVMGKGAHAGGDGGPCNPQPFLHLKFLLQKCSPAPSPPKSKALV